MQNQQIIIDTVIISAGIVLLLVLSIAYLVRQNFHQSQLLRESFLTQVAQAKFDIEENTLANISKKIHDEIQPNLVYSRMFLEGFQTSPVEEIIFRANHVYTKISAIINDIRTMMKGVNSTFVVQNGLTYSIEQLLEEINLLRNLSAELIIKGLPKTIDSNKELILFRMIQESINNSIKHSLADKLIITLDFGSDFLNVTIEDDGIGFDKNETLINCFKNYSSGIKSMIEKAKAIRAEFNLRTDPGEGTRIFITTPY